MGPFVRKEALRIAEDTEQGIYPIESAPMDPIPSTRLNVEKAITRYFF